jgi:hypothetical protein
MNPTTSQVILPTPPLECDLPAIAYSNFMMDLLWQKLVINHQANSPSTLHYFRLLYQADRLLYQADRWRTLNESAGTQ